jgi:DNA invertase Pin-like site-specific DNA recombinase
MVMLHRLLMEQSLGRYLTGREVVHHEDGDQTNNCIENLRLFPDQASHMRHHQQRTAKRYNPEVIEMVRAAASDPNMTQKDLGMSPMTVLTICREQGIEWKKPPAQHLDEDIVREALRGRSTLEAAEILGCNHQTLRNHWDHLLVKRKSPTHRKRS